MMFVSLLYADEIQVQQNANTSTDNNKSEEVSKVKVYVTAENHPNETGVYSRKTFTYFV